MGRRGGSQGPRTSAGGARRAPPARGRSGAGPRCTVQTPGSQSWGPGRSRRDLQHQRIPRRSLEDRPIQQRASTERRVTLQAGGELCGGEGTRATLSSLWSGHRHQDSVYFPNLPGGTWVPTGKTVLLQPLLLDSGKVSAGVTFLPLGRHPQLFPGLAPHLQPVNALPESLQLHAGIQGLHEEKCHRWFFSPGLERAPRAPATRA